MIIKNANIYDENRGFQVGDIYIENSLIVGNAISDQQEIDATGLYAIPGLIDLHFHGCDGYDFCDGSQEAFEKIAKYQARNGVTTICPATMTLGEEELISILSTFYDYQKEKDEQRSTEDKGAEYCGVYLEGPFISKNKKGAQNSEYIKNPDITMFRKLQATSGNHIKLVAIAPEIDGALDFIEELKEEAVISIAHTEANYQQAKNALQKGARQITHLYNAMPPLSHREPGVIGAALDTDECHVELICDGIHIHPSVIRATFAMFGEEKIVLISDSMMATGLSDGVYSLGRQEVNVSGRTAQIVANGAIAGSVTNLMDCVRFLVKEVGISLEKAIRCASVNPAKVLGIYSKCGSITPGKVANIVLLNQDLDIKGIILKGRVLE